MGTKKIKRTKGMRPKVSSHLNVGTVVTSTTDADAQRTLNHKMAKRRRQPNHQLRTRPLPRPSRAGLSKYRLNISTIIRVSGPGLAGARAGDGLVCSFDASLYFSLMGFGLGVLLL